MDFSAERHAPKLKALAEQGIYLGTSSWKYEGWIGQVYRADYSGARSSVSKKRFEAECLSEYASIFPTVCFDGGYWRFPEPKQLCSYAEQLPDDFKFAIKVTNTITERRNRDGRTNPDYLIAQLFVEQFLDPVRSSLGEKLGPIVFEFSPYFFGKPFGQIDYSPLGFVKDLHAFLNVIPKTDLKLAVEVRDPELLAFPRYLDCLEYHGVAHVLNEQTWMPEILEQIEVPGVFSAPFSVIRALVRPGTKHNEAVEEFAPYNRTQLALPRLREGLAQAVQQANASRRGLYAYVNNRTEGNAPNTLAAVLEILYPDPQNTP
ncbi:MAG: DUF72 domain-containing protein [Bacteroidota bacterium]|nr:DUF72 domain-containing protein [Bacteroidota bacterium]MDP4233063.1 DUF72 domain-containing protein [Bacteroidota bacterium]MDP4241792.1 DUF72 domain-containing protein [Bacteroidota bacterium]MDP4288787.1 DUF72 domain-containing protein [Bacteroidota bacterium]